MESANIINGNSCTKLETSVRSLSDDNERLREKCSMQLADNEKMCSCEFRLLKEKCDSQFNEILSLKSQMSNAFFSNKGRDTSINGVATSNTESRKPTALLVGTSNLNGIKPDKLSTSVDILKSTAYTFEEAYSTIENYESKPDVVLLHALTNDIKNHSPEECTENLGEVVQVISSKWKKYKNHRVSNNSEK